MQSSVSLRQWWDNFKIKNKSDNLPFFYIHIVMTFQMAYLPWSSLFFTRSPEWSFWNVNQIMSTQNPPMTFHLRIKSRVLSVTLHGPIQFVSPVPLTSFLFLASSNLPIQVPKLFFPQDVLMVYSLISFGSLVDYSFFRDIFIGHFTQPPPPWLLLFLISLGFIFLLSTFQNLTLNILHIGCHLFVLSFYSLLKCKSKCRDP